MKKKTALLRALLALTSSAVLLAGCGGGGGGGDGAAAPAPAPAPAPITPTTALGASSQYEGIVAGCSVETQKRFVRAYLDEVYLWYNEIPNVDASLYTRTDQIDDYFNALLVRTPDASGLQRDRFSSVLPASRAEALQQSFAPQQLDPTASKNHTNAVPITRVVTSPAGRRVGYIQFNDHQSGAQDDLITAFRQLQSGQVQDLVLDLRVNTGGFLYVALTAASMVSGPQSEGKVFERLRYNDKRQAETTSNTLLFSSKVQFQESQQYPLGTQLPQLNLPRLFVLATPRTCSASESIINSLRGIDVQVIQIGTPEVNEAGVPATCGKPYGFHQKNNCGWAFFPIEFQGTNAKGFGDYTTGFRHTCQVADNNAPRGSSTDAMLNAALVYADTNACPAGTAVTAQSSSTPILSEVVRPDRPAWTGRMLLPQQQQR